MGKRIIAVIIGISCATAVMFGLELASQILYPAPNGLNMNDSQAIANWVSTLPFNAFLLILGSYAAGSFLGGLVAALVARREVIRPSLIVGAALTISGGMNLYSVPHPLWFVIVSTLMYIPCSWLGAKSVVRT